jgi:hypothetical protein
LRKTRFDDKSVTAVQIVPAWLLHNTRATIFIVGDWGRHDGAFRERGDGETID